MSEYNNKALESLAAVNVTGDSHTGTHGSREYSVMEYNLFSINNIGCYTGKRNGKFIKVDRVMIPYGKVQQRIALARAILKNAPIVLLDEATAFADPENEYKIQMAFERLTKGKTVLMIAHRLPTIQNADEILVLEQGAAAERGTHNSLMAQNGIYASMWRDYQTSVAWNIGKEGHYAS